MADDIVGLPKLKVDDLKKELQKRGLKTKGTKSELQERLLEYLKKDVVATDTTTESDDKDVDVSDLGQCVEDELEASIDDPPIDKEIEDSSLVKEDVPVTANGNPSSKKTAVVVAPEPLVAKPIMALKPGFGNTAEEKRLQRGKRFGEVTNETDKKKLRAERFKINDSTTGVTVKGKTITGDELEMLKKRADRFGVISPAMDKVNENERKAKRQERFGVITSVSTTPQRLNTDAAKKKRAERFGIN
eukprot:gene3735-4257_t